MALSASFRDMLAELLAPAGTIAIRRMFGGAGLYVDVIIVGLLDDDTLFLKVDDLNRPDFEAEGMAPFTYATSTGQNSLPSYWRCPERLFDEPDELIAWVRRSLGASQRAAKPKGKGSRRKPSRRQGST